MLVRLIEVIHCSLVTFKSWPYIIHFGDRCPNFKVRCGCKSPRAGMLTVIRILTIYNFLYRDVNKRTDNSF